jgi:hypothetical protein
MNTIYVRESCPRRNADGIRKRIPETDLKTPQKTLLENRSSSFGPIHETLVFANRKQECVTVAKRGVSNVSVCDFSIFSSRYQWLLRDTNGRIAGYRYGFHSNASDEYVRT